MARVFTDGAEMGDLLFWTTTHGTTVQSANTYTGSGTYHYQIATGGSNCMKTISAISELYMAFRLRFNGYSDESRFPRFRNSSTNLAYLSIDNISAQLEAYAGSTLVGASTDTFSLDTWYFIEIYLKIADSPNGRFVVKVDGNTEIDYTGDTLRVTPTTIDNISFFNNYITTKIDDLRLNDTTGGVDDSWLGNGQIISVYPDDNGTTNDWTGSDADSTDNYLLVDEVPNDGDTTYVYEDGTASGSQDQYGLSDYSGSDKIIQRIYVEARARKTSADAATLKLGFLPSGGSDDMSSGLALFESYRRLVGDEHTVNPVDSAAWEEADIDALELVVEVG